MSELREYELVYILMPDLTEDGVKKINDKMKVILEKNRADKVDLKDLGKKFLSYRINKQTKGHYFELQFTSSGLVIEELERNLRLTEQVLRFLTVKRPKIPAKYAAQKAPKQEGVSHEV